MTVCLQELQGTLEKQAIGILYRTGIKLHAVAPVLQLVCVLLLQKTYRCVAIGAGEGAEVFLSQIFELILLRTHREDWLSTTT